MEEEQKQFQQTLQLLESSSDVFLGLAKKVPESVEKVKVALKLLGETTAERDEWFKKAMENYNKALEQQQNQRAELKSKLDEINEEIRQLRGKKAEMAALANEITERTKSLEATNTNISEMKNQEQKLRDEIDRLNTVDIPNTTKSLELFAMMSNITWDTNSENVRGYVAYDSPKDVKPIELDAKYKGTVKLADYLWNLIHTRPETQ